MASNNVFSNYSSNCSGFYYDEQRKNPLMSITLHANQKAIDEGLKWDKVSDPDDDGYEKKPLCTALMGEDFSVAIANNWSEFDAGNMLESAWNSIRPLGAYSRHIGKLMGNMVNAGNNWLSKHADGSTEWAQKLNSGLGKVNDFINNSDKTNILNHALVVQGTRFSYYAGTGTSFSNLNMKFTLFADHFETGGFKTVHEQLQDLYPYIMGKYVNVDGSNKSGEEKEGNLDEFFGWQKAPGGFKPDIKNIDNTVIGTLKLKFGSYYSIKNLVCRDAQLSFSKQMVKYNSTSSSIDYSPLYCDVVLSFQPATKYSDNALRKFVDGSLTESDRSDFTKKLRGDLDNIRSDMSSIIEGYSKYV